MAAPPALAMALLADDLSGACDSAVAFAERGLRTEVGFGASLRPSPETEVWCRNSESRDLGPTQLHHHLAAELSSLPPSLGFFKKIDSVFRGNTFEEIAILLKLRPGIPAVLAPAFPAAGRTSRAGVMRVSDISGTRSIAVVDELQQRGLQVTNLATESDESRLSDTLQRHWRTGPRLLHCDAGHQDDLDLIVRAAKATGQQVLWIGSAGLARALAADLPQQAPAKLPQPVRGGEVVFFIGSDHPVTLAQISALRDHSRDAVHIRIFNVDSEAQLHRNAEELNPADVGCIFVTGGGTATLVCQALGVTSLSVLREFAPGLPECEVIGGRFAGTRMVLKSGGFGEREVLCAVAEEFGHIAQATH